MRGLVIEYYTHITGSPGGRMYATAAYEDEYGVAHNVSTDDPDTMHELRQAFISQTPVKIEIRVTREARRA